MVLVAATACSAEQASCPKPGVTIKGSPMHAEVDGPNVHEVELVSGTLRDDGELKIVARVCHPDGEQALDSVELRSVDGDRTYGTFDKQNDEYVLEATWDQLNEAVPISFVGATTKLSLAVWATDDGNRDGWRALDLTLACDEGGACDGTCMSLSDDPENCGGCGATCAGAEQPGFGTLCQDGACRPTLSGCFEPSVPPGGGLSSDTCEQVCGTAGELCRPICFGSAFYRYGSLADCEAFQQSSAGETCEEVLPEVMTAPFVRCCCTQVR